MCVVVMLTGKMPDRHTHACGHICECECAERPPCPMCQIALVIQSAYSSLNLTPEEAIAHLFAAIKDEMEDAPINGST